MFISYGRGLLVLFYPSRRAMREPKKWDKRDQLPRFLYFYSVMFFFLIIVRIGSCRSNLVFIHIGENDPSTGKEV